MATEEKLKITISADNADAVASLNELSQQLKKFEKGVKDATNGSDLLAFNKSLTETKAKMEVLNASLNPITAQTKNLATGSNQAAQALTNVGRVAQDLPFGFMGIQNNLNPLLESFQRLKAETGSGKEAIKALGSSLIGAGGLGLALSLVSGAILIYQNGIAGFNSKTKEAKEAINQFNDSGVLKAVEGVRSLEREIQLAKQGIISKDGVINHYNETIGKTTGLVDNLNEAEIKLKNNAPDYIKMQLAKAAANLALADAAKLEMEIAELQNRKTQEFGKSGKFGAGMSSAPGFVPGQGADMGMKARSDANAAEKKRLEAELQKKLADKKSIYEKFAKQNEDLFKQHPEWNFFDDNKPGKVGSTSTPADISRQAKVDPRPLQEMVSVNAQLKERLSLLTAISDQMQKQAQKEKEKAFFNVGGVAPVKSQALADYDQEQLAKQQMILGIEQSRKSELDEINKKFLEQKSLVESVGNTFQNMIVNVANSKNPFEALTTAVKQLVIDLAAAAARMYLIKALMTAINPAAGAAKGIGGILGGIIGFGAHAEGGVTTGPSMGLIGEAGPEAILPLDRFKGFVDQAGRMGAMSVMGSGNSGGGGNGEFVLRGNDLVLALQRSNYSLNLRRGS